MKCWIRALVLAMACCAISGSAQAEMYRCTGPDGRTLFTSNKALCPGAEAHQPRGQIQRSDAPRRSATERAARRRAIAPASGDADAAMAASWREKKTRSQARLATLSRKLPNMQRAVGWCNRGDELFYEDEDGIRRSLSCTKVKQEYARAEAERKELEAYLEEGLEEECRRAGCLPGWIR